MKKEVIIIGADHAGFEVKEKLRDILEKKYIIQDVSISYVDGDDYPDYAIKVAEQVAKNAGTRGILVCGSAEGMCIAANKVKGARASAPYDTYSAKMSKEHNDSNVLCLRARKFPLATTKKILNAWLNASFSGEERHQRRIKKITNYEQRR